MNRKKTRRFLAGLLLIAIIYTLPTATAFAEDTATTEETVVTPLETAEDASAATTYEITFEGGDGATGDAPTIYAIAADVKLILPANTFTKEGCTFMGWKDSASVYAAGDEYIMPASAVTFTAQWEAADDATTPVALDVTALEIVDGLSTTTTYAITFVGGDGATGTTPTMDAATEGAIIILPGNPFTKDGFTFTGWNDTTSTYAIGAEYTMPGHAVTFTAQWEALPTYAITFAGGDGATGAAPTMAAVAAGVIITLPDNTFTKDGCRFASWNDSASAYAAGAASTYAAGAAYTVTASAVTFTAQWEVVQSEVYLNGTTGNDMNGGTTSAAAVKTFEKAKNKLARDGIIRITGGVTISADATWSLPAADYGTAKVMRDPSYTGALVTETGGTFTLENIIIDGNKDLVTAAAAIIKITGGNTVLSEGAILRNNYNSSTAISGGGGGVLLSGAAGILTINGGAITKNGCAKYGGGVHIYQGAFAMDSGEISENTTQQGGGISIQGNAKNIPFINISGGAITGNTDNTSAPGIYIGAAYTNQISNNANISDGIYLANAPAYITPTSALTHDLKIQIPSAGLVANRVVAAGSSYTLKNTDCQRLKLVGTSEWYLKLNSSNQICLTKDPPNYSPYSIKLDERDADELEGNSFLVDVSLSGMDASTLSEIETYIRYDGGLVSFAEGSGDSGLSPAGITVEPVSGESIIELTLQGGSVVMAENATIKLATLKFTPRENSGTAVFSIENTETHDTFVTESGGGAQLDVDTTSTASRPLTVTFELISNETYNALLDGYYLAVLYEAPGDGNIWLYDGQPMYKADDEKYLYIVTGADLTRSKAQAKVTTAAGITITNPAISYDGDVNGDGKVNILDAQNAYDLALPTSAYRNGFEVLNMKARLEADMNKDNRVTSADASLIFSIIAPN